MSDDFQAAVIAAEEIWCEGHSLIKTTLRLLRPEVGNTPEPPPRGTYRRLRDIKRRLANTLRPYSDRTGIDADNDPPWRFDLIPIRDEWDLEGVVCALTKHRETPIDWAAFDELETVVRAQFAGWRTKQEDKGVALKPVERALAILVRHPEWSNTQIAKHIGVSRQTLYKKSFKEFQRAREAMEAGRDELPKGGKDGDTGSIEAWDGDTFGDT